MSTEELSIQTLTPVPLSLLSPSPTSLYHASSRSSRTPTRAPAKADLSVTTRTIPILSRASSTPRLPPVPMLLFLPNELIERTIRLAFPSQTTSTTYAERQSTLLSLARSHSRLNAIVKLILLELVIIESQRGWQKTLKRLEDDGAASLVRKLVQQAELDKKDEMWPGLSRLLPQLGALRKLQLR